MDESLRTQERSVGSGNRVTAAIRDRPGSFKVPATLKGWILLGTGLVLCPGHLPETLVVMTSIFTGAAFGAFLADNLFLVGGAVALYSIAALVFGYHMLNRAYRWKLFG